MLPTNSWVELGLHIVIALLKVRCVFWWASTHPYHINASILVFRLGEGGGSVRKGSCSCLERGLQVGARSGSGTLAVSTVSSL